jgi:hypothetical protein
MNVYDIVEESWDLEQKIKEEDTFNTIRAVETLAYIKISGWRNIITGI